ncbi:PaaI family thioesterase [Streptomyces sp. NPDC021093]|uniref:PaaI family thioesterase n=1 Tax=Streptomyces sp. NPDC021093 TaxID=3365112 RepID=UPI0037A18A89
MKPPEGFPEAGGKTARRALLDLIVAGTAPAPPCIDRLRLPNCDRWGPGWVTVDFVCTAEFAVRENTIFGGYIAALIDQYAGLVMLTLMPDDRDFLTGELTLEFLAPLAVGPVRVEAEATELTRRHATVAVRLFQGGDLRCRGTATQIMRKVTT